ncbi:hypothetical protein NE398_12190 [Clostridium tertium]|uniref:Phage metallopeptidase domain-containing protein n=1 Tax=Clostridium tertium TaxID=1559 RepID=A0A9X3XPW8_9CLOT|nr:hypothetical protein [Clostridium tertium]MDC4240917.1 hypothetical protein [Clostridium tertium]
MRLKIRNYTCIISDKEVMECLELLPKQYKELDIYINIFERNIQYLGYLLKKFKILNFIAECILFIVNKFLKTCVNGYYNIESKEIYILGENMYKQIDLRLNNIEKSKGYEEYKEFITKDILKYYREQWIKYMIINMLIHELTHAIQDKEKRLSKNWLKRFFTKWEKREEEIDAMRATIEFSTKYEENFLEILNVKGITANHSLQEFKYKYNLKIRK